MDKSIEIKLAEKNSKIKKIENKTNECEMDLSRIDSNLATISEGLNMMQDGQFSFNTDVDQRLVQVEKFMSAMKNSIVANNGVQVWNEHEANHE